MRTAIVIPARYGSTRLHAKALLKSTGKYLIQHVYEQAIQARCAERVLIATDDMRIEAAVRSFGGEVVMTRKDHPSGTDRIAEVARGLDVDILVNVQGDEPMIDPAAIDRLADLLRDNPTAEVATLAVPITSVEVYRNPNCVKVVCDQGGRALYFSRSPIPMVRDGEPDFQKRPAQFLHHLGLYAYRKPTLLQLAATPPATIEQLEKLEQLRLLAGGGTIQVGVVGHAAGGVDTFEDYQRFVQAYRHAKQAIRRAA
ncbi:3-deoxy-manno-octulosonate cytidylyltransferase [Tuwongella immobilis]|uniref:3-deoxy-manno-octulosonate cytidylyltransferase n=1 Tax=Tuwongella immobilis TaxID=692036 RepID=A0A6C2YK83_9BACT|nr:3-deoxy-manno-octulosonate cytidylyltransferase [Tuwongella immobilis]VIP01787.1 3-deoxy-manno-octulosonate cytidylyltransferase : 3-deoxy-manno-octulosonate cytidylyltransferase OS=Singulisphaera acidiphila (strain ATCC BAA-1392 / DSM 18658 / VKM B-2454 / MOB10) GN=kdsB PE=3 SV=1: CTP_transf_3 [Tuwongella immobilis]VTR99448.1 3-deoxy-manno-octulosonate cytidylyltransferase : 3-deoxy-manno-octulosonate cytidylyltransferase OS=Singulisphaera acidiphila (strain ATCC BAA-1392 / DSM 18658 / VKM B-